MYEKVAIISQIWNKAKYYFTSISNTWYLITVANMNNTTTLFSEISQQTLKIYEKIKIIIQNWDSQILFYVHHGTKYEKNPSSHHEGMCEDGQTYKLMDCPFFSIFPDSAIVEWGICE